MIRTRLIGTYHGEKLYKPLMTREKRLCSEDTGHYYRVAAGNRDLSCNKFVVKGEVQTMADDAYTSRLDVARRLPQRRGYRVNLPPPNICSRFPFIRPSIESSRPY